MKPVLTVAAAVCMGISTGAYAQTAGDQGSELTLSYTNYSSDFLPANVSSLHFSTTGAYNFTPAFGIQYGVGFNRFSLSEGGSRISVDLVDFDLHGYYNVSRGVKVGVFVSDFVLDQITLDFGGPSGTISPDIYALVYGGEAMASFGALDVEAYAGVGALDGSDIGSTNVDIFTYGVDVSYAISSSVSLNAGINGVNLDIESGAASFDLLSYSVGAEYAFNSDLSINANIHGGTLRIDGDGLDMFGYGIGVEYDLPVNIMGGSELTAFASVKSTNLSTTFSSDSEDVLTYEIGVKMSFGGAASGNDFFSGPTLF